MRRKPCCFPALTNPNHSAARRALRAVLAPGRHKSRRGAEKPIVTASRLPSYQSQTKTGTVVERFPRMRGSSQLRFASSGPHSPPRRRTRGRRCLCLPAPARWSYFGSFTGRLYSPALRPIPHPIHLAGPPNRPHSSRHTNRGVLAQPFYNTKKSRRGQQICSKQSFFSKSPRSTASSRRRIVAAVRNLRGRTSRRPRP